ncbi:MAG TPA: hypothetical protein VG318_07875 [Actinomycetota bacterium]|nr:hypothetical protein [Actinomycetota bacterium]
MKQFVIVFDRPRGEILEMVEFPEAERDVALKELFDREERFRDEADVEVVMLGSDSIETLKATHGRYFKGELQRRTRALG